MPEYRGRSRLLPKLLIVLVLGGCGQTGPLVLPGSAPASSETPTAEADEEDDEAQQ